VSHVPKEKTSKKGQTLTVFWCYLVSGIRREWQVQLWEFRERSIWVFSHFIITDWFLSIQSLTHIFNSQLSFLTFSDTRRSQLVEFFSRCKGSGRLWRRVSPTPDQGRSERGTNEIAYNTSYSPFATVSLFPCYTWAWLTNLFNIQYPDDPVIDDLCFVIEFLRSCCIFFRCNTTSWLMFLGNILRYS
jgi:hypothetical protein